MTLYCVQCKKPKEKAMFIMHGASLCENHFNEKVEWVNCKTCPEEMLGKRHKHIKVETAKE